MTGEQFLIPPFELNFVVNEYEYECECASCRVSKSRKNLVEKLFFSWLSVPSAVDSKFSFDLLLSVVFDARP